MPTTGCIRKTHSSLQLQGASQNTLVAPTTGCITNKHASLQLQDVSQKQILTPNTGCITKTHSSLQLQLVSEFEGYVERNVAKIRKVCFGKFGGRIAGCVNFHTATI